MAESLLKIERAEISLAKCFFHFGRPLTGGDDRSVLEDCFIFNLHIPCYVDWAPQRGPAHPGVFGDAFPAILSQLVGPGNVLTLHLESVDTSFFDELTFIREVLTPQRLEFLLLPNRPDPKYPTKKTGNLLFEWPVDSLQHIVDEWFKDMIEIEGYVSPRSCLGELAKLYFQPYNAGTIRELLRTIEFSFSVWIDSNGLYIFSDKLGEEALRKRVMDPDVDATIRTAIRDATGRVWSRPTDVT